MKNYNAEMLGETGRDDLIHADEAYEVDEETGEIYDLVEGYTFEKWDDLYIVIGKDNAVIVVGETVYRSHSELFELLGCYTYILHSWLGEADEIDNAIDRAFWEMKHPLILK